MSTNSSTAKMLPSYYLSFLPQDQEGKACCPACNHPLTLSSDNMHLVCENELCPGKLYRRIEILAKAFKIENIGIKVAQELVQYTGIKSEADFLNLSESLIGRVPRYKAGMTHKIFESIASVREGVDDGGVQWVDFIRGIQIYHIGDGTAPLLASSFTSLDSLLSATPSQISAVVGCTLPFANRIVDSIISRKDLITSIYSSIHVIFPTHTDSSVEAVTENETETEAVEKKSTILAVVTGPLHFGTRPAFQSYYNESTFGVKWASAVSGNVNILVTNETTPTSKFKAAQALQQKGNPIRIMTEQEFIELMGGTSIKESAMDSQSQLANSISSVGSMDIISL